MTPSSGNLRSGTPTSRRREARIAWLVAHPDLWQTLPSDLDDVDDAQRAGLVALGETMIAAGVYSARTQASDRTWGIRVLIGEARDRMTRR